MKNIVLFASGKGSNAKVIIDYFANRDDVEIAQVLSNNREAQVLKMARNRRISTRHFQRKTFYQTNEILQVLQQLKPDLIVLAGFMWIVPQNMLKAFPNKIINIHPALLPKYGGKGMYGEKVHQAVLHHREKETGISIHYVNENYDEGELIAQFKTTILPQDNLYSVIEKVKALEHQHYSKIIDNLLFPEK